MNKKRKGSETDEKKDGSNLPAPPTSVSYKKTYKNSQKESKNSQKETSKSRRSREKEDSARDKGQEVKLTAKEEKQKDIERRAAKYSHLPVYDKAEEERKQKERHQKMSKVFDDCGKNLESITDLTSTHMSKKGIALVPTPFDEPEETREPLDNHTIRYKNGILNNRNSDAQIQGKLPTAASGRNTTNLQQTEAARLHNSTESGAKMSHLENVSKTETLLQTNQNISETKMVAKTNKSALTSQSTMKDKETGVVIGEESLPTPPPTPKTLVKQIDVFPIPPTSPQKENHSKQSVKSDDNPFTKSLSSEDNPFKKSVHKKSTTSLNSKRDESITVIKLSRCPTEESLDSESVKDNTQSSVSTTYESLGHTFRELTSKMQDAVADLRADPEVPFIDDREEVKTHKRDDLVDGANGPSDFAPVEMSSKDVEMSESDMDRAIAEAIGLDTDNQVEKLQLAALGSTPGESVIVSDMENSQL